LGVPVTISYLWQFVIDEYVAGYYTTEVPLRKLTATITVHLR